LGHDEDVVLAGELAERLRLLARDVDGALAGEAGVVEVEDLVVEGLQRALGEGDEPHRNGQAREPGGGLHQGTQVVEVDLDVAALADPAHGRDQPHRHVRLDHLPHLPCRLGYWIAWSARARMGAGIVTPTTFAVFRLTTSVNVSGRSMGRSPGRAP